MLDRRRRLERGTGDFMTGERSLILLILAMNLIMVLRKTLGIKGKGWNGFIFRDRIYRSEINFSSFWNIFKKLKSLCYNNRSFIYSINEIFGFLIMIRD